MLINENRGMLSRTGRSSTEKFQILLRKDEILNGTGKKFKPPILFSEAKDEKFKEQIKFQDEPQEIFFEENIEEKKKPKKQKKSEEKIFQYKKTEAYMQRFEDLRKKTKDLNIVPSCTKYQPKNEFIWKKTKQYPTWESTKKKNKSRKPEEIIQPKYYKDIKYKFEPKVFIDMSKQTDRKSFINIKKKEQNLEENLNYFSNNQNIDENYSNTISNIRSERKRLKSAGILRMNKNFKVEYENGLKNNDYDNNLKKDELHLKNANKDLISDCTGNNLIKKDDLNQDDLFQEDIPSLEFDVDPLDLNSENLIDLKKEKENNLHRPMSVKSLNTNYNNKSKSKAIFSISENNNSSRKFIRNIKSANPHSFRKNFKNPAPDFRKTISRETRERIYDDKKRVMPFSIPPYEKTRPRSVLLVNYDIKPHKPRSSKRPTTTPALEMNFNPHKLLEKVNNHKKAPIPNFRLMSSRPNKNSLPSYMQKLQTRQGTTLFTDKALEMNNFSSGNFAQNETCFWPKKSYNKIVNLNLLSSRKFIENVGLQQEYNKAKINQVNDYIEKSMKFYNKNFEDLIKESMLNKFDCITYRHIRKENKLDTGELEKFILNLQKSKH